MEIVQSLVYGILIGSLYGLAAAGLGLVFGVMRFLNIAHGYLLVLGGYVTYYLFSGGLVNILGSESGNVHLFSIDFPAIWPFNQAPYGPFLSIIIVMIVLFGIGALLFKLIYGRLAALPEAGRIKNSLLVSFGLGLAIQQLAILSFSGDERTIPLNLGTINILGLRLPMIQLMGLLIAFLLIILLNQFLTRTYFGKSVRATSQDHEIASIMGINVKRTYLISFSIGLALAGVAGTMLLLGYSITPTIGQQWTMKALVIIVLAGMGRISGVLYAGILLGVVEALSVYLIPDGEPYREVVGLVLFILVLIFRPQGLFGRKAGET
ncbi:branched-chain amino acid ABC transporter permease [Chloroflexota bacterium]